MFSSRSPRGTRATLLLALPLLLTACVDVIQAPSAQPDTIRVTITGLPDEVSANATLAGPAGLEHALPESETLTGLPAGAYTLMAEDATYRHSTFNPEPPQQQLTLEDKGLAATIAYAPHRAYSEAALAHLNEYRATAGVPPLALDANGSLPNWLHARYAAENGVTGHSEDPTLPWYSTEGHQAGLASNLTYSRNTWGYSDRWKNPTWPIESFVDAPFHFFHLLRPTATSARIATYYSPADCEASPCEPKDRHWMVGAVEIRGPWTWPAGKTIRFPEAEQTVTALEHHSETPSPLTACPGYVAPAGLPIFVMHGPANVPRVTSSSLTLGGTAVEHCVFTTDTYTNPNASHQDTGRGLLEAFGAIVLLPREPLEPKSTYRVQISSDRGTEAWSFHTGDVETELSGRRGRPSTHVD